ncbi:MAG: tetratricopeptide repeat protein [Bacteroidetes bacterium]|nr:tetratricopeptide repeat protein [Bacteroidota bacterium]
MTNNYSALSIHTYIDELNQQAEAEFRDKQYEHALQITQQAERLSVEHKHLEGKGLALRIRGKILYTLVRYDEAHEYFHQAVGIFQEIGDPLQIARSLQGLATTYYATGRLLHSLEENLNAFSVMELGGLEKHSLDIVGNIVLCYHSLGEFYYAIEYAHKQLALARKYNSTNYSARALSSLGELYFRIADYTTSLNYSNEGLALVVDKKNIIAESGFLSNIGSVYYLLGNYTNALDSMMKSIAVAELYPDKSILSPLLNTVCCIYGKMQNDSLALDYAMRALAIDIEFADPKGEAYTLHNIASVFEQNGDITTAIEYAKKSYGLFVNSSIKEGEAETLILLATCNTKLGDYITAINNAKDALEIAETIQAHTMLQSSLQQLLSLSNLIGDSSAAEHYSRRLTLTTKIIAKEEQRKNAEKILREAQIKRTQEQAQLLISSTKTKLTGDFLDKTQTLKQQGFVLATIANTKTVKKSKVSHSIIVRTFGLFSVTIDGRELTSDDWQRKKARDIFKILLINHRKSVTVDELIGHLWPDAYSKNLIPTLWNSVSYIRKALEPNIKPHTPSAFIKITGKSYMLDLGKDVSIDFLEFKELLNSSRHEKHEETKYMLIEKAISLYNGEFLKDDVLEEWSDFQRESLKELYLEATLDIGNYYLNQGKLSKAIQFARKTIEADKVYENGYELLFTALADNQQLSELTKAWKLCQSAYKKELDTTPPEYLAKLILLA